MKKVNKKYLILLLTLTVIGCSGMKNLTELSKLTIENRQANKLIVNRKPDFGDGHRDGCIVTEEISMDITKLNASLISGKVFDSKTRKPLIYAQLSLFLNHNSQIDSTKVSADSNGLFKIGLEGELYKIEVQYIGYRDLIVDLKKYNKARN